MKEAVTSRHARGQSEFAVKFFMATLALFGLAGLVMLVLVHASRGRIAVNAHFPVPFWASTLLLIAGSISLQRSLGYVRRERQRPFRRWLAIALGAGTLFVGVQGYGLWWLMQNQTVPRAISGVTAFVFVFVAMHGLHVTVALMFLTFVTLRAFADRYDHEYYWGVTICAWFWHALGMVWAGLLLVFAITA